ncbi:TetR/AcrR family transcriptional regulator [Phytoactinopolyspora alkaliphila]|uniref:TetR/AcrR family transcriptional regulator n=1 Tax=Phytoactinopolyspora alkaliphila TaxID=1783498 RepID=A0A6N9YNW8_9ACTN|nr:TetR/AcrR family transcriptional regulator [Phytoactinopolyspora alkaliphila]
MTPEPQDTPETGVRQRTRRAIVDAAIGVWAREFNASLSDIAERANVSRSTLHRYFPDRKTLVDAALRASVEILTEESEKATAGCETAAEELEALMRAMIDVGDAIIFLFADPDRFSDSSHWREDEDEELPVLIQRAQADGALRADVDPSWIVGIFYSIIYVAAESINTGHMARHRAGDVAVQTFLHGLAGTGN